MEPDELDPAQRARCAALCREAGLDPSYGAFVARHLDAADESWRWCCGSRCDPCAIDLGRVVDAARRQLGGPS